MNRPKRVLVICSDRTHKESIRRNLESASYKVAFISSLLEVENAITQLKPCALVQDWAAVDSSQSRMFHYKFAQKDQGIPVVRVILVPEITDQIRLFTSDAQIDEVLSYASSTLNLSQELDRLIFRRSHSPLHELKSKLKSGKTSYEQDELDNYVIEAVKKYPDNLDIQIEFGGLCLRLKKFDESERYSRQVLDKEPKNLRAMNLLARSLMHNGDHQSAAEILKKANILGPFNPARLMALGDAFYGTGELDQAVSFYQQAKGIDPSLASTSDRKICQVHLEQGDIEAGLEIFRDSLSEDEAASVFNNAAVSLAKDQDFENALSLYQVALNTLQSTESYMAPIFFNIALCYVRQKDRVSADKYLKKSLTANPKFEKALRLAEKITVPPSPAI